MSKNCNDIKIEIDKSDELLKNVKLGVACACFEFIASFNSAFYKNNFNNLISELARKIKSKHTLENLKDNPVVRAFRDYYWRVGIDPTKTRPAGEALARRLLQENLFRSINPIVDAGNLASAETFIPIGIYDINKIGKSLELKLSKGEEIFVPIGGEEKRLNKGIPILIDEKATVIHVFPHRDSMLTKVGDNTRCVLIIAAGVPGISIVEIKEAIEKIKHYAEKIGLKIESWHGPLIIQ